jgi:Putative Flp pilus-assembly TadE/G-like
MRRTRESLLRRLHKNERGQILVFVALAMVALLAMVGFVVDVGDFYYSYHELQASSDAAALAGGSALPGATAAAVATSYSSVAGGKNVYANLPNVTMAPGYPQVVCLTTLENLTPTVPCLPPAGGNAIVVKQIATVQMYFATIVGIHTMTITATATAAMRGAKVGAHNVVIVLDTTSSMNDIDSSVNCNGTRISCAIAGAQQLLGALTPCGTTCGAVTQGNAANPVDEVSLMVFPGLASGQAQYDYDCANKTNPQIAPYTYPTPMSLYQVIPFSSDYRASDAATSLNPSSDLARATGAVTSCTQGLIAVGGEGTYYAGVIYAAQATLAAEAALRPTAQNELILLSDGDSNATASHMPGASTKTLVYPSTQNQCHQAITAAQSATAAGTVVYTVAYGAEATGCSTDSPKITPCQTMQQIASSSTTFFSDYTATGGDITCVSAARPSTSLSQIFADIAANFGGARLIPNNLQ